MLSTQELVLLNQYVQGIKPMNAIMDWFNSFDADVKKDILIQIWSLANQARANEEDIESARSMASLKATHTPVRMLYSEKMSFKHRGYNLADLKGKEQEQAFLIILNCFAIAEKRRKSRCDTDKENCNHWWHQDLSNLIILQEILKENC